MIILMLMPRSIISVKNTFVPIFIISDLETLVVVDVPTQHPAIICLSAMLEQIKKIPPSPLGPHHN